MSEKSDALRKLLDGHALMKGAQWAQQHEARELQRLAGDFEIEKCVPGEVVKEGDSGFYMVRHDFPLDTRQGCIELGAALDVRAEHIAFSACDSELHDFDPMTAVFIDTETSGLAGGAGTTAFLVGVGYFTENVFRLDQCFMRDFDDEEPMLAYLATLFRRAETVVTFNGKSFDVPLLRTRFISNRLPFHLDGAMHFDLVHAVRRIWKMRLRDCSLGSIERHVLGIQRQGDVAGYEIPQLWFDYLRTRDARELPRVFYHHRNDILSLVSLTGLLSRCVEQPHGDDALQHHEDRLSMVRLHLRNKRWDDVVTHATKLLESDLDNVLRRECLDMLGNAAKRVQNWTCMVDALTLMAHEFPSDHRPRLELAKHYEHRARNLPKAAQMCEEAIQYLAASDSPWLAEGFQHRLDRIYRKLNRPFL